MKKILFVAIVGGMMACHSSKYAANFQYYKSNTGYEEQIKPGESVMTPIQPEKLIASNSKEPVLATVKAPQISTEAAVQVRKTYLQMNKAERKTLRKALKAMVKNNAAIHPAHPANPDHPDREWWQGWDQDLKLAAIFGAIGTVAIIIYVEPFFIIGAVALIIGLVFFIKWFVRQ